MLESPNAIVVAFGDMVCGKAVDLVGTACVVWVFIISIFF